MVPPPRLERGTPRSTIWCSNQLSYGGTEGAMYPGLAGISSGGRVIAVHALDGRAAVPRCLRLPCPVHNGLPAPLVG